MPRKAVRTLGDLDEDEIVRRLKKLLPATRTARLGIGDDCALWPGPDKHHELLLKTDCVVEGVHFLPTTPAASIGWKALCRALSDIAAMAGSPGAALITLAAARETPWERIAGIYRGLRRAAEAYRVEIVGGESTSLPTGAPLLLSVSLTGQCRIGRAITRAGARPGDALFVTGVLGGSIRGWHLKFTPRLREAAWLAQYFPPTAMMDLSDGLARDLPRLARASGVSFELFPDRLPRRKGCDLSAALEDGEDYELLFSLPASKAPALLADWKKQKWTTRLTQIGCLKNPQLPSPILTRGWDHFAPRSTP